MIKAGNIDKERVIDLLAGCFETNKTVNWIVKQDNKKKQRIRELMDYSFEACVDYEQIYLSDDRNGVIICSMSDDKMPFLKEAYLTARFVLKVTGIDRIGKILQRERYVSSFHPQEEEFLYIWFIAVDRSQQGKGTGSRMLEMVIDKSSEEQIPIYLETSTERNLPFYLQHGFEVYHVSEKKKFGYELYFLRKLP